MADAPFIPTALVVTGAYLAWFGVHYWRTDVAWPSDPVKAVLTGKQIPVGTKSSTALLTTSVVGPGMQIYNDVTQMQEQQAIGAISGALGPSSGGVYSKDALHTLWTSNGGDPGTAAVAAAVALAESSGNPAATSSNPDGGTNVGLWQLDTRGVGSGYSIEQLKDANTNARVTIMGSSNGSHWGPWQTYVEGTYKKFL